jgi:formate-dependent nitrite reductase membrane component NrfD
MKLLPKEFNEYNPVVLLLGVGFVVVGGYPLLMLPGPPIVWVIRGVFAAFWAIGLIIVVSQVQLWKKRRTSK